MELIKEGFPNQTLIRLPLASRQRMVALPLAKAIYPTDIGNYPEAHSHYVDRPNGDPGFIILYSLGGQGFCEMGGKRWSINKHQAILIPANMPHVYGTPEGESWRYHWLHFKGTHASELFYHLHENEKSPLIYIPNPKPIIEAFEDTIRWTNKGLMDTHLIALCGACCRLLGLIVEGKRPRATRTRACEERIRLSVDRIRETFKHPLSLEDLAKEASLSIAHYSSLFKKTTGTTPMQLYTQMRTQLACQLLHNTHLSVTEIAEEVGYEDALYFSRVFKKSLGIAPSEFRNDRRSGSNNSL